MRHIRGISLIAVGAFFLAGCSTSEAESENIVPSSRAEERPVLENKSSTQNGSSPLGERESHEVTHAKSMREDLVVLGFEPAPAEYDEVVAWHEDNICNTVLDDIGERGGFLFYVLTVTGEFGPDVPRVIAQHKCPERTTILESFIEQAEAR